MRICFGSHEACGKRYFLGLSLWKPTGYGIAGGEFNTLRAASRLPAIFTIMAILVISKIETLLGKQATS
jgi:hypothetical protein